MHVRIVRWRKAERGRTLRYEDSPHCEGAAGLSTIHGLPLPSLRESFSKLTQSTASHSSTSSWADFILCTALSLFISIGHDRAMTRGSRIIGWIFREIKTRGVDVQTLDPPLDSALMLIGSMGLAYRPTANLGSGTSTPEMVRLWI